MPAQLNHRLQQIAFSIPLSLAGIEATMAQQAATHGVAETSTKKSHEAPWPKKHDLFAIKHFIGPKAYAVQPVATKPDQLPPHTSRAPSAAERVDSTTDLYNFPQTQDAMPVTTQTETPREFAPSIEQPAAETSTNHAAIPALLGADIATVPYALELLAGDSNAHLVKATLNSDSPVSATLLSAMRQVDSAAGLGNQNTPSRLAGESEGDGRVWMQALGHEGELGREYDTLQHSTHGLVVGADWRIGGQWRIGVMGGKSRTRQNSHELDGELDSWHLGAYALYQDGPMSLRLGTTYNSHDGTSKRRVDLYQFSDRPKGRYDANTQQAFAEVGYNLGRANVSIEPFASLGYQRYQRDSYTEKGGAAALKVHGQTEDNLSSTFGLRLAKLNRLENGMRLTPRFSAGWKHTYGEVYTETRQRLVNGGNDFSVYSAPQDRDSLLVDAGLDLGLSPQHTLGVGLTGQIGSDSRTHGVMGHWQMSF